jgi:hypothetical protein
MTPFTKENSPFSSYLFWDIDIATLDMEEHQAYIVERVLDYGKFEDWCYIRDYYGIEKLREIALGIRSMHKKSLAFIATVTNTPETQFRCYKLIQSPPAPWVY